MKILFFAPIAGIHARRWISFFTKQEGLQVMVATTDIAAEPLPGADIYRFERPQRLGSRFLYYLRYHRPFRKGINDLIKYIQPDIIHLHWLDFAASCLLGTGDIPVVATAWGSDILILPGRSLAHRLALRRIYKRARVITCDAEHLKSEMMRQGADANKIRIIYFGTDMNDFGPHKHDPNLAVELGFEPGSELVISLRALKPIYNIETFIMAMPDILSKRPFARFVIVGDGPEHDMLRKKVESLDLSRYVRFTGRLSDTDLQRYTASADVYVSTSLSDGGLAASTAEAMASEVPVVISDFGNNRQWVEHGKSGMLFPLKDSSALAASVVCMLENPEQAKAIASQGQKIIAERNSYEREMFKVLELYRELMNNSGR